MLRFARTRRVMFWEEPMSAAPDAGPSLEEKVCEKTGVVVLTPRLPDAIQGADRDQALKSLLDDRLTNEPRELVRWYYTPMMLPFSRHIGSVCTVYDCMDELKNFKFAPPEMAALEQELFTAADVVFTGGYSLYEAKQDSHRNIHPFPSSVDRDHFGQARKIAVDPVDQID
ncbi:MAG: UDP-galactopyranose mutase, partial [Alphaproteobacteria bacterium]